MRVPRWLDEEISQDQSTKFEYQYLGQCRIDVYRAPGDLNDFWDIRNAESQEIPYAGYGCDAPAPSTDLEDYPILKLWQLTFTHYRGGHFHQEIAVYTHDGEYIAGRQW